MRYLSFDIERALNEPANVFDHPREVLCVVNLRDEERLEILDAWRGQVIERRGGEAPDARRQTLASIDRAIDELERIEPVRSPLGTGLVSGTLYSRHQEAAGT